MNRIKSKSGNESWKCLTFDIKQSKWSKANLKFSSQNVWHSDNYQLGDPECFGLMSVRAVQTTWSSTGLSLSGMVQRTWSVGAIRVKPWSQHGRTRLDITTLIKYIILIRLVGMLVVDIPVVLCHAETKVWLCCPNKSVSLHHSWQRQPCTGPRGLHCSHTHQPKSLRIVQLIIVWVSDILTAITSSEFQIRFWTF